jgi:CBS-domain-containing membrane protein
VHASGRKVEDVMTPDPWTIRQDDSLEGVVEMMERHHVKRLPVTSGSRMVGIVSRANLMHALATFAHDLPAPTSGDSAIRANILAVFAKQSWAPRVNVIFKDGTAEYTASSLTIASAKASWSRPKMSRVSKRCTIIWFG